MNWLEQLNSTHWQRQRKRQNSKRAIGVQARRFRSCYRNQDEECATGKSNIASTKFNKYILEDTDEEENYFYINIASNDNIWCKFYYICGMCKL